MTRHNLHDCTSWARRSVFELFLAKIQANNTPFAVMAVRSDVGGEVFGGNFRNLCHKRGIKQEFTSVDSPNYNGVGEQTLALINDTAVAVGIQAPVLYLGAPVYPPLWAEAVAWAYQVLTGPQPQKILATSPHTRCGMVRLPTPGEV